MSDSPLPKILCVDDEPNILRALRRTLRRDFDVVTAESGEEGLRLLREEGSFTVIISDMRMPGMDGATFLAAACHCSPNSVRLLLTGQADIDSAIAAINEGRIFRFLCKPCPTDVLIQALADALRQHQLITAEQVLLQQTLHGSIEALTEVLSLASPLAFSRANRLRVLAREIGGALRLDGLWQIEIAAMLSQVGWIVVPPESMEALLRGDALGPEERAMAARLPAITAQILRRIPRLEVVREIVQSLHMKPSAVSERARDGVRLLAPLIRYEQLLACGQGPEQAAEALILRPGHFDGEVLDALRPHAARDLGSEESEEVHARQLRVGMKLLADLRTQAGRLLLPRGKVLTEPLLELIRNFSRRSGIVEPLLIQRQTTGDAPPEVEPPKGATPVPPLLLRRR